MPHPIDASITAPGTAGWWLSVYPTAGEAGGSFVYSGPRAPRSWVPGTPAANPERARSEAARRARGKLRRYCAANGLNRLGTLTYAPPFCHDPRQARADVGVFFRNLREGLGGRALPYVWVPEWHKTGGRLHLHFAVGRYVDKYLIRDAWGHGYIDIKLLSDLPVGSGTVEEARKAAAYLSKYVGKAFEDERRVHGLHRFDVAQGFQPESVRVYGRSEDEAVDGAVEVMDGRLPTRRWSSADDPEWQGPPATWAAW